jgi:hypothetical protein
MDSYMITIILLLIFLFILISIVIINNKTKSDTNDIESFRYFRSRQMALLSAAEQAVKIKRKLDQAIQLYQFIMANKDNIKTLFQALSGDWNALKVKFCVWASKQKLLVGLIALLNKAKIDPNVASGPKALINKLRKVLLKLLSFTTLVTNFKPILTTISSNGTYRDIINTISDIDNQLIRIFEALPGFGTCQSNYNANGITPDKLNSLQNELMSSTSTGTISDDVTASYPPDPDDN